MQEAYSTTLGTPPSTQEHIITTLQKVERALDRINTDAYKLINGHEISFLDTQALTQQWNYAMQLLETVLNPERLVIASTLILPSSYNLSAGFSDIATRMAALSPGQPSHVERMKQDLDDSAIARVSCALFSCNKQLQLLCDRNEQMDLGAFLKENKITIQEVWNGIFMCGGSSLRIPGFPNNLRYGHALALFAVQIDNEPMFVLRDPMGAQEYFTLDSMKKHLEKYHQVSAFLHPLQ